MDTELIEYLEYIDGGLYWKKVTSNRAKVGDRVGNLNSDGYREFRLLGKRYYEHRVIWSIFNTTSPTHIDHVNAVKDDNRPENLRSATPSQNFYNRRAQRGRKYKGCYHVRGNWWASIKDNKKTRYLGSFDCEADAAQAFNYAAAKLHGEFAKLNESQESISWL